MSTQMPDELWLDIFHRLPRESFADLCLTCRDFLAISRPLLFSRLSFHPYFINGYYDNLAQPVPKYVQSALERLEFWSSEEIAPFVRECTIFPLNPCQWRTGPPAEYLRPDASSCVLLSTFFGRLHKFKRLVKLSAFRVYFSQAGLVALCQLPLLGEAKISDCRFFSGVEPPPALQLRVTIFAFEAKSHAPDSLRFWIPLLRPEHLREPELSSNSYSIAKALSAVPPFPLVQKFTTQVNLYPIHRHIVTFSKFPAVRVLQLTAWAFNPTPGLESEEGHGMPGSDVFPLLEEYTCNCDALYLFLGRPSLTRVIVPHGCTHAQLVQQLQGKSNHLLSLRADLYDLDNSGLSAICSCLPNLVDLHIDIFNNNFLETLPSLIPKFFSLLAETSSLPPRLERFAISWEFGDALEDEEPSYIPDLSHIRQGLLMRCPALRTLWLDGDLFIFRWRRIALRGNRVREEEESEIGAGRVADVRVKLSDFWDGL